MMRQIKPMVKKTIYHKGDGSNHSHVKGSKKGHLKNGGSKGAKVLGNTSIGSKAGKTSSKLPSMLDVNYKGEAKTKESKASLKARTLKETKAFEFPSFEDWKKSQSK